MPERIGGARRARSVVLGVGILLVALQGCGAPAHRQPPPSNPALAQEPPSSATGISPQRQDALRSQLQSLAQESGGQVGIAIRHVETGTAISIGGEQRLPLYSVAKLPLAVAVLYRVETGDLTLEQTVEINAGDLAPGVKMNQEKWADLPRTVTVRHMLEFSLIDSDNTSSDKLLELIGGPEPLTAILHGMDLEGITVRSAIKNTPRESSYPNVGTADALAGLLSFVQQDSLLAPHLGAVLRTIMSQSRTGGRRIRAGLPPGTPLFEKTGSGRSGSATNNVGVATLPDGAGHLVIAVLMSGSPLPPQEQEDRIADVARVAYAAFATGLEE